MRKKGISALLAVVIVFSTFPAYSAKSVADLRRELEENGRNTEETKRQIREKEEERSSQKARKDELDIEIGGLEDDIARIQGVIDEKDRIIGEKNEAIERLNGDIAETWERLRKRMKVIYENGAESFLEIILNSKGITDLFTRLAVVDSILKHDNGMVEEYRGQIAELDEAKGVVEREKGEQLEAQGILEGKRDELKPKQEEQARIVEELEGDIEELKRQEAAQERAAGELQAQIDSALKTPSQSSVPYKGNGKFGFPLTSYTRVSSPYGYRIHPITGTRKLHSGIDYAAPYGTSILAAEDGTVLTAGWNSGYGFCVTINHGGGYVTLYGHCSSLLVTAGQKVKKGQTIAKVGSTGNSTGNHLHFEVRVNGSPVDPSGYL